ncbi:pentapeptide repeat-containing protein [Streptomyces sp. NPDC096193]|uniref:pentapeptide repeat-containing protein n=1 Tax=Streptomyces sp. NPDC096193 TaxID=3155821 RepID=UPI003327858F
MSDEQPATGRRPWWIWAAAAAGAILFIAALIWGPWWMERRHLHTKNGDLVPSAGIIVTGFRTMLIAIAAGVFTGVGLWYTHRSHHHAERLYEHSQEQFHHARKKDREQADLTREGQVTERYVEAVKLLSSDNLTQQLGGIYALERVMKDSARDHPTVVEVLSAFIQTKLEETGDGYPIPKDDSLGADLGPPCKRHHNRLPRLNQEVSAALKVLTRRPDEQRQSVPTDLSYCRLCDYDLTGIDLRWANLHHADLKGACLQGASLQNAQLTFADLRYSDISDAQLAGALLAFADLDGALLRRTNLRDAKRVKARTLIYTYLYRDTKLPIDLNAEDIRISARIQACEIELADSRNERSH